MFFIESMTDSSGQEVLTDEQKQQVQKLKSRDAEVKRHEAAHLAVAGGAAGGGPVYNYQAGPDGKAYAVEGHVDIEVSGVAADPKATIAKMQQVQHAALAPADPSGQDRAVAAQAAAAEQKARAERTTYQALELVKSRRIDSFSRPAHRRQCLKPILPAPPSLLTKQAMD